MIELEKVTKDFSTYNFECDEVENVSKERLDNNENSDKAKNHKGGMRIAFSLRDYFLIFAALSADF
jgi:hypothetical protein